MYKVRDYRVCVLKLYKFFITEKTEDAFDFMIKFFKTFLSIYIMIYQSYIFCFK